MSRPSSPHIAIIGAGLSGIACARELQRLGASVTVFEKSRGYGGRCATKRWNDCRIDHGAQYFTFRDDRFRAALEAAAGDSIQRLTAPIVDDSLSPLPDSGRFYHRDGNSRLARDLANSLGVHLETTIARVTPIGDQWIVDGQPFDAVVSTAPWPQTQRLLGHLGPETNPFIPCLALMVQYQGQWIGSTQNQYAVSHRTSPTLAWSACENHKPHRIAADTTVLIAHANEAFSRQHFESDPAHWSALLKQDLETQWSIDPDLTLDHLPHRWKFARVGFPFTPPSLPKNVHHLSDALTQSRVESAWINGHEAALKILATL